MDYKDRGIIKWAPFDALVGFNQMISDLKNRLGRKDKPILQEDQLFEMDCIIKEAITNKKELQIDYYHEGYIKSIYGFIKKVDLYNRQLILEYQIIISLEDIVNLSVLN